MLNIGQGLFKTIQERPSDNNPTQNVIQKSADYLAFQYVELLEYRQSESMYSSFNQS